MKKFVEFLKECNPYRLVSAAMILISVCIIIVNLIIGLFDSGKKQDDTVIKDPPIAVSKEMEECGSEEKEEASTGQGTEENLKGTELLEGKAEVETTVAKESEAAEVSSDQLVEPTSDVKQELTVAPTPEPTPETAPQPELEVKPEPSPNPTQESLVEPTSEPMVESTPELTPDPKPEQTMEPIPEQSPEPTPEPTSEPTPEPTPEPTLEATPEPSPESTLEPTPGPTLEPTPEPIPEESLDKEEISGPVKKECNHSWLFDSYFQAPTCSNGGLENQICAHCGTTQVTAGTPTGKHEYVVENAGDCCSEEVSICKECNHRLVGEKDSTNHIDVEDGFCYGCGKRAD